MIKGLTRDELIRLVEIISRPRGTGFSSGEINQKLLTFCANCPDPVGAMTLVVDCMTPMTSEELVDKALALPLRNMKDVPMSELPLGHPLRQMDSNT